MNGSLPKEYLSPSQINMYLRCPAQYYFRYEEGIKMPPRSALTKGTCVHKGIEHNYRQKIESKKDVKVNEVKEVVSSEFDERKDETDWRDGEDPGKIKDRTVGLAEMYHVNMAPTIQPLWVEQEVEVPIETFGLVLKGYLDLVDEDMWIRDNKTTGRTPNKSVIDKSLQLSAYYFAYRAITGESPKGVKLDYMVDIKTPKLVTFEGKRTQREIDRFVNTAGSVAAAIKNNVYYPNEGNFMCSPEHCGYWDICHKHF